MNAQTDFLPGNPPPDPVPPGSRASCTGAAGCWCAAQEPTAGAPPDPGSPGAEVLREGQLRELGLQPQRSHFLGSSAGRPCFAWELDPQAPAPDGLEFVELRGLWGLLPDEEFWLAGRAFQIMDWDRTHLYCGRCGAPMQAKTDERAKLCPSCGLVELPAGGAGHHRGRGARRHDPPGAARDASRPRCTA